MKARGCRQVKSLLAPVAQPFAYSEFELYAAHDRFSVNQAEVLESFYPIREDILKYAVGTSILRLSDEAMPEGEPNEALFKLLYYSLSFLAYSESEPEDLLIGFLAKYLNVIGYRPSLVTCAKCQKSLLNEQQVFYSPENGGAICESCAGNDKNVSKTALEAVRRILLLQDDELRRVRLKTALRKEIMDILSMQVEFSFEYGDKALSFYTEFCRQSGKTL